MQEDTTMWQVIKNSEGQTRRLKLDNPYVGYCSLLCPHMVGTERHNRWELQWHDEVPQILGWYGDDLNNIVKTANAYIREKLLAAAEIQATAGMIPEKPE
jgi:hypothetical protein